MNLIAIDIPQNQKLHINFYELQKRINNTLSSNSISTIYQTKNLIEFLCLQQIKQGMEILTNVRINFQTHTLNISSEILSVDILRIKSQYQKTLLLRKILKLVRSKQSFKIALNPLSGEIFCEINLSLYSCNNIQKIQSLLYAAMLKFTQETFSEFINLIDVMNLYNRPSNLYSEQNDEIKNHIAVSNFYCWYVTRGNTTQNPKSASSFIVYDQFKKRFSQMQKIEKESIRIKYYSKIYNIGSSKPTIKYLDATTDQKLQKNYLGFGVKNNEGKKLQITQITLPEQILNKITQDQLNCKIQPHEQGELFVRIKKIQNLPARKRELDILKSLPEKQFWNIPRYFIIKKNIEFNQRYQISNLFQVVSIQEFMEKNKESVSIFTKLGLMHQLTNFLRYLRDLNIIYQNLLPKNIFIKKALVLKATNFSNIFNFTSNLDSKDDPKEDPQLLFPYVLTNIYGNNKTCDDQRSDVYSYGIFIYWMIFGKDTMNLKESTFRKGLPEQTIKKRLFKSKISPFEINRYYGNDIFKLLLGFSFKCSYAHYAKPISLKKDNIQQYLMLQQRPFLDWIVIITKEIYLQYQNQYLRC